MWKLCHLINEALFLTLHILLYRIPTKLERYERWKCVFFLKRVCNRPLTLWLVKSLFWSFRSYTNLLLSHKDRLKTIFSSSRKKGRAVFVFLSSSMLLSLYFNHIMTYLIYQTFRWRRLIKSISSQRDFFTWKNGFTFLWRESSLLKTYSPTNLYYFKT